MRPIRVLGIGNADKGLAITYLRMIWPMELLNKRPDFDCSWITPEDLAKAIDQDGETLFDEFDLVVNLRVHGPIGKYPMPFLRAKRVIYDIDDDMTDQTRVFGRGSWIRGLVKGVDAVTCTGPWLAERMGEFGKPVHILPNYVNTEWYRERSMASSRQLEGLTIGFAGTGTHFFDWMEPLEALKRIAVDYPEVKIVAVGSHPEYLRSLPKHLQMMGLPFEGYPALIRQLDIRLCPLEPPDVEPFNLCKSPISALEAMAAARPVNGSVGGCIPVVSDHPVFKGTVQTGTNGLVVTPDGWYDAIASLIEQEDLRQYLAIEGHEWVKQHADIRRHVGKWASVYREVVKN